MEVDVLNMKGKKVSTVELPEQIFAATINVDLMHQAYVRQMANARLGTHKTKSRGEVRGGGRKPWRQKGTGRARHGTIRSPIWVGGGGVHTPRPRDYSKKMPRKMRQAALRSALSVKAADQELVMVDELSIKEPKTKLMVEALSKLVGEGSTLVLLPSNGEEYDDIRRSTNNLRHVKLLKANYLNVRDLLGYDKVVMPLAALEIITSHLGQKEG